MAGRMKGLVKKMVRFGASSAEPFDRYKKESWSQSGEDLIVEYLFGLRKMERPSYLDIGAYHPVVANNTYKFFRKGARGVNIDANPSAIEKFTALRPGDVNLNIGIGPQAGEFDFFIMEDEALNTFSRDEKDRLETMGQRLKEIKKVNVLPVNTILEKYFHKAAPDLVSIDAEGVDFGIVGSYDFEKFAPKVICLETINYTPDGTGSRRTDLCEAIEERGYFEYANTNINSIYVNRKWWFGKHESLS